VTAASLEPGYFDRLYADRADPWGFTTSAYEHAKYAATLAALPDARFACAVEVGCSIGVLTRRLAGRCDALLGLDVADAALAAAAARCVDVPWVTFARSTLPMTPPPGAFDLIVLSEVLYYFDADGVVAMAAAARAMAAPAATLMLVHWLGPTPDYPLTGEAAVAAFLAAAPWATIVHQARTPQYRIDVLRAPGG